MGNDWERNYRSGDAPWDTGSPAPLLVQAVEAGDLPRGRLLEIGCGTGTNARFLAGHGWEVVGVDFAPTAIDLARGQGGDVLYEVLDILAADPPGGPYDAVFDRGCFHVFDRAEDRATFARRVAGALRPGGVWLSLIGSTEGAERGGGPPRRSMRDVAEAVEPELELLSLRSSFADDDAEPAFWSCRSRKRLVPAQPSTRR